MPYYEWQWIVDDLQEYLEEQQKSHGDSKTSSDKDFKKMQQNMLVQQRSMMQNVAQPKIEMPKMPSAFDWLH